MEMTLDQKLTFIRDKAYRFIPDLIVVNQRDYDEILDAVLDCESIVAVEATYAPDEGMFIAGVPVMVDAWEQTKDEVAYLTATERGVLTVGP